MVTPAEGGVILSLLSVEDVLAIRKRLAATLVGRRDACGADAPLYPDRLEMAVHRQTTGFEGALKYEAVHDIAATLFYGLATNHAFENGNKRTALVCLLVFLDRAQRTLVDVNEDQLYELVTFVVDHSVPLSRGEDRNAVTEVAAVGRWLRQRIVPLGAGDRKMEFRELRALLEARGCTFDDPDRNYIKIRRGGKSAQIGYPRQNFEVGVSTIKRIRRQLELDRLENVEFYAIDVRVDEFVSQYRNLMRRLEDM